VRRMSILNTSVVVLVVNIACVTGVLAQFQESQAGGELSGAGTVGGFEREACHTGTVPLSR
jgi:hypothetical protein